uniref:DNL-type domain-containing protein n=1 Tax=Neobodo designis TaxID=312471 RepID=A0A7S1MFP9_NEODS|mmetsp:Transcript_39834/g.123104  ORF Transcript_39834/g.123104 Transcript_39834/m.123104 type:complete len:293 (+) Transcript_39834:115-993(+)
MFRHASARAFSARCASVAPMSSARAFANAAAPSPAGALRLHGGAAMQPLRANASLMTTAVGSTFAVRGLSTTAPMLAIARTNVLADAAGGEKTGNGSSAAAATGSTELAVSEDSDELYRAQSQGSGAEPSGSAAAPADSTATDAADGAKPVAQFQTNFRPLSKVDGIDDADRELIRRALRNNGEDESAPAASETADGVKKRLGGVGHGVKGGDMAAVFTCNVCQTRSVKRFTKHAYTKGVVMVQCPGCGNKHLLADNLGWFNDNYKNVEEMLAAKGEEVKRLQGSVFLDEDV